jgi:carboxyl-terminal processing protease
MAWTHRFGKTLVILGTFATASVLALRYGQGGLWSGLQAGQPVEAHAAQKSMPATDPAELAAVSETLKKIRDNYVDPDRIDPRAMFLNALNQIQREVAQVIVLHKGNSPDVTVRVGSAEKQFRVDNIEGPWDVLKRLREVFVFLSKHLKDDDVELREVEYAAANGMLQTLDPHSVFLSPESYDEMNLSTSGHFGGLGIVISIRDQMLTIMKPMPETPAGRSGLQRLDRIIKVNDESTLNMPLEDAVSRLRGPEGTPVTVWIQRDGPKGWKGLKPFTLTRERIRIRSVEERRLDNGVGYVRLKHFQATTARELDAALKQMEKPGPLKGLIMDLRGNPGGLLDQARQVSDRFLSSGPIVSTVGGAEGRDTKSARPDGNEPDYPIILLTSPSSASASEIVAGALKAHDRALIVGQRTFGKGSVQLVFPQITNDGAALKLTIAQYLTPGDVSIQGVGVAPDVLLDPMTADPLEMDLHRSDHPLRERDLSKSLETGNAAQTTADQPNYKLRYNLTQRERNEMRDRGADIDDKFREDFPITFAKTLAARLPHGTRTSQVRASREIVEAARDAELESISGDLRELGIDWSSPPADRADTPEQENFEVKVTTDRDGNSVRAGESMNLSVSVTNNGPVPVYQLRATTKSDGGYFTGKELVFGRINPGETKVAKTPLGWCETLGRKPGSTKPLPKDAKRVCTIPEDAPTRSDVVKIRFDAADGESPAEALVYPTIQALPGPVFAYTYQLVDNRKGNGDGKLAPGEEATLYLTVQNVGTGASHETQANLRNLTGDGLLLKAGRFDLSEMKPGEIRQIAFTFDALPKLAANGEDGDNAVKLELSVVDRDMRIATAEKLSIPLQANNLRLDPAQGRVRVQASTGAMVREAPEASSRIVGQLKTGTVLKRDATYGKFTKVALTKDRFGFVETSALEDTQKAASPRGFDTVASYSPPLLEVTPAALVTRDDSVLIEGKASDGDKVLDVFMFVGPQKVFYKSNRGSSKPKEMAFSHQVKLNPGVNVITVVVRENDDSTTRKTLVVRRDGPAGEPLTTPKFGLFGADWEFGGEAKRAEPKNEKPGAGHAPD